ncbi:MAG: FtsW/RodA/SpoVE family cell cycle protein [Verrucomicrobia bacterium]|nr:FtsW/RodA/SpoVE family cell cycle protein [Verrucomicrobiota bacterium]
MGARRWILLGPFQFQPSEFAKIATIFALASYLSRPAPEVATPGLFFKSLGLCLLPFVLILREPDLGSALVFLPVGLVMMFVAGCRRGSCGGWSGVGRWRWGCCWRTSCGRRRTGRWSSSSLTRSEG